jgi:glycosyltransferase involved in cell wall biosynthesis
MIPISIFIITKNEADRLPKTLESIKGLSDDVVVVDSGSTDNTVAVAESFGARVFTNEWRGYGPQKCFAEKQCKHHWLLNLDADEALSPQLMEEIQALFARGEPTAACYSLDIRMVLPHENKPRLFAANNRVKRLYDYRCAGFKDSPVHDSVVVRDGTTEMLQHPVYHRSFRGLQHEVEKINRYSTMQAEDMLKRGKRPLAVRLIAEPFGAFLKAYFLRRYFAYGVEGFTQSIIYAFARTLRLAKARELFLKIRHEKHIAQN